jgi:hypothetical protein
MAITLPGAVEFSGPKTVVENPTVDEAANLGYKEASVPELAETIIGP